MPDLPLSRDRLQPALFDRLVDDGSGGRAEDPFRGRVIDRARLRELVRRDLGWLLNSTASLTADEAERYPQAARSTINFGIRPLAGRTVSHDEVEPIRRMLHDSIAHFEPRLLRDTLVVRPVVGPGRKGALHFEIAAQLWAHPYPIDLLLRTSIDLDTGDSEVTEGRPGGEA